MIEKGSRYENAKQFAGENGKAPVFGGIRPRKIGSAAGVALMGQASGVYTFFSHLKWSWAIALGYAASIWVHFLVNGAAF